MGRESDGAVICGEGLSSNRCCWATAAAYKAACADCCFGVEEKKFVKRVAFEKDVLRLTPVVSF